MLEVRHLSIEINGLTALEPVGFSLGRGQSLGIVGESGSGKSLLALALIGLLPAAARVRGEIRFNGTNLLTLDDAGWCRIRGAAIGMVFQEPMTALNPAQPIGAQVAEGLRLHRGLGSDAAAAEALRLLDRVRIPNAAGRMRQYPHELSGGQRQRVGIAIALACEPVLLLADEPTTALDVTVQAEILDLLAELAGDSGLALLLISHDLGVVATTTERVMVLYAGQCVETGPTTEVLAHPRHPYTAGLLKAMPGAAGARLETIPGAVPPLGQRPIGCSFRDRCGLADPRCAERPDLNAVADARFVACHHRDRLR
jgi:peptide/nickel transport system ATP-binding protein